MTAPMSRESIRVERFTQGEGVEVEVGAIERDLAALWRQSGDKGHAVTRACLWNLVVIVDHEVALEEARTTVDAIITSVPARVVIVSRASAIGGDAEVQAWASARCQVAPGGGKLLCSEEITIAASGRGRAHVAPLVRALLVPDVPAALVVAGLPQDLDHASAHLGDVGRVIVDTGHPSVASHDGLARLGELARRARGLADLVDLAWLRSGPFRLLFAAFFDPPIGTAPLRRAQRLLIECEPKGEAGALLLAGWLGSRLGWSAPARTGRSAWRLQKGDGAVEIVVEVSEGAAGPDGIRSFKLETSDGASFGIRDHGEATIALTGTGLPERIVGSPEHPDGALLVAALGARGFDPLFNTSLAYALALAGCADAAR